MDKAFPPTDLDLQDVKAQGLFFPILFVHVSLFIGLLAGLSVSNFDDVMGKDFLSISGNSSSQTGPSPDAIARVCLIASVSSTATREPIKPPSRPPTAHVPTLVNRGCSLSFAIVLNHLHLMLDLDDK